MSMYVFGIVVAASDETPIGRASATLQVQLPALYPEHRFQFLGCKDLKSEEAELLFQVLVAEVRDVTDDEVVSEMASPDLVQTLQNAVDGIVAAFSMSSALAVFEVGDEIELGWRLLLANRLVLHPCMMTLHF